MKPTFKTSRPGRPSEASRPFDFHNSKTPSTDWSFHATTADLRGGTIPFHPGQRSRRAPGFHTLSQGFLSTEANRESRIEGALFCVIVALATWPIVLAVQAAFDLLK